MMRLLRIAVTSKTLIPNGDCSRKRTKYISILFCSSLLSGSFDIYTRVSTVYYSYCPQINIKYIFSKEMQMYVDTSVWMEFKVINENFCLFHQKNREKKRCENPFVDPQKLYHHKTQRIIFQQFWLKLFEELQRITTLQELPCIFILSSPKFS